MSTFTHTLRVTAVLDDGTVYDLSNVYTIEAVDRVIQGYQTKGSIVPPAVETPDFLMVRSVAGVVQVDLVTAVGNLSADLLPGNVWVVPDSTNMSTDNSGTNFNVDDPVTEIDFDNAAPASVVEYIGLITYAS